MVRPKGQNQAQSRNLKGNQDGLKSEKVPPRDEAERVVNPFAREPDEAAADGHVDGHLGHGVVDHGHDDVVDQEGEEEVAGPGVVKGAADADEDGGADGGAEADELDLAVREVPLQAVGAAGQDAVLVFSVGD